MAQFNRQTTKTYSCRHFLLSLLHQLNDGNYRDNYTQATFSTPNAGYFTIKVLLYIQRETQ